MNAVRKKKYQAMTREELLEALDRALKDKDHYQRRLKNERRR